MNNQTVINVTGEPVTEQAPAVDTTNTSTAPTALPSGYLENGYFATAADQGGAKYLRPEFVKDFAQQIAAALAPLRSVDFNGLMREMKRNKKRALPFEARQTAALEMLPKSLALVHRKKAPEILIDFIKANLDAIKTDEDWYAYYRHLEAIAGYMIGGDT